MGAKISKNTFAPVNKIPFGLKKNQSFEGKGRKRRSSWREIDTGF